MILITSDFGDGGPYYIYPIPNQYSSIYGNPIIDTSIFDSIAKKMWY